MGFFDDPDFSNSIVERLWNVLAEVAAEAPGRMGDVSEVSRRSPNSTMSCL